MDLNITGIECLNARNPNSSMQFITRSPMFSILMENNPQMLITLHNDHYIAGDFVSGEIILKTQSPLNKCELFLISEGFEELRVFKSLKLSLEKKHKVFNIDISIRYWQELHPAFHKLPFKFKLPQYIPPTFLFAGEDSNKDFITASIGYKVSVKFAYESTDFSESKPFTVLSQNSLRASRSIIHSERLILNCCCFKLGSTSFKFEMLNDTHDMLNGVFRYRLIPDNSHSRISIYKISSRVIRDFAFECGEDSYMIQNVLNNICRLIWIPAHSRLKCEDQCVFEHDIRIDKSLNTGSVDSNMIKCKFFIEVKVFYESRLKKQPVCIKNEFHVDPTTQKVSLSEIDIEDTYEEHPLINIIID